MRTFLHALARVIVTAIFSFVFFRAFASPSDWEDPGGSLFLLGLILILTIPWFLWLGRPFVNWIGEIGSRIFYPSDASFQCQPQYSIAEARTKEGRYEEAIER